MPGSVLRVLNKAQRKEELLLLPHFTDEETEVCGEVQFPPHSRDIHKKKKEHKSLMCGFGTHTLGPWGILASESQGEDLSLS